MSFCTLNGHHYFTNRYGVNTYVFSITPQSELARANIKSKKLLPLLFYSFDLEKTFAQLSEHHKRLDHAAKVIWKRMGNYIDYGSGASLHEAFHFYIKRENSKIKDLDLSGLALTTLPLQLTLIKDLETLNLGDNKFCSLPPELQRFKKLKVLILSGNEALTQNLPDWLKNMPCKVIID